MESYIYKPYVYLASCFFVVANILDNKGIIGFKYISIFTLVLALFQVKHSINKRKLSFFVAIVFFFILSIIMTIINNGDLSKAMSYNNFFLITILFVFLIRHVDRIKLLHFVMNTFFYSSLMIILGNVFSNLFPYDPIIDFLRYFAMNYDEYEGIRHATVSGNLFPKIYFHFTLYLPSALVYFLFNKKYIKSLLLLIAIILSLSRGAIIVSFLVLLVYFFKSQSLKNILGRLILFFISSLILVQVIDFFVVNISTHIFSLTSASNYTVSSRINQTLLVYELLSNNLLYFFFGMGSGTPFYSTFLQEFIYHIEISPLELVRKYGFLFTLGFMTLFFRAVANSTFINSIILLSLLLATLTNPILTSPIFILICFLCYDFEIKKT